MIFKNNLEENKETNQKPHLSLWFGLLLSVFFLFTLFPIPTLVFSIQQAQLFSEDTYTISGYI